MSSKSRIEKRIPNEKATGPAARCGKFLILRLTDFGFRVIRTLSKISVVHFLFDAFDFFVQR